MTRRTDRINGLLRQEISQLLSSELNDPRLSGVVSITKVETSSDLTYARVFVSVLGDNSHQETVLSGINSAAGYIRRQLRSRLSMRFVPELNFILDHSIEEAEQVFRLMDRLTYDQDSNPGPRDGLADSQA